MTINEFLRDKLHEKKLKFQVSYYDDDDNESEEFFKSQDAAETFYYEKEDEGYRAYMYLRDENSDSYWQEMSPGDDVEAYDFE